MFEQMKDAKHVAHEDDWLDFFRTVYDPKSEKSPDSARRALAKAKNRPYLSGRIRTFNEYAWFSDAYEGPDG
jgi:hypothetical protein